jgi:hypothetical protein
VTMTISVDMSITSITTRSSMGTHHVRRTGLIRHFVNGWRRVRIRWTGPCLRRPDVLDPHGGLEPALQRQKLARIGCREVPTVVVPASHRARRVKVEASCVANLDAPARDAVWTRQRRPQWLPGETEFRHVQAQSVACLQHPGFECVDRRSFAPVHRPVRSQRRQPASRPARHGRHALQPAVRCRQPPGAARGRRPVSFTRAQAVPAPGLFSTSDCSDEAPQ